MKIRSVKVEFFSCGRTDIHEEENNRLS